MKYLPSICLAAIAAASLALPAHADPIDALRDVLADPQTSPVPQGWLLGGAAMHSTSAFEDGPSSTLAFPGAVYIGERVMFLGDRATYSLGSSGDLKFHARLRWRFGALDPDDRAQWDGLSERKGQLEAGLGATWATPMGLGAARFSSDISGRSKGQEVALAWSLPWVRERWLVMPGVAAVWRSDRLANYYFGGVSPSEAAPGRPAYDVGAAWSYNLSVIATYRWSERWLVAGLFNHEIFSSAIEDSPIVQRKGRDLVLVAVGYVWR